MRRFRTFLFGTAGIVLVGLVAGSSAAHAATTVNFCTGAKDGNYNFAGIQIAAQARGILTINIINTAGSMENLAKLDTGGCDAAIVQSDAYNLYMKNNANSQLTLERGRALYSEYLHLICNKSAGISSIDDLTAKTTVLIGPNGSGSAVTWESLKLANAKKFGGVPTLPVGGLRAIGRVQDGSDAACSIYVIGLKAPAIMEANKVAIDSNGRIGLVEADDSALLATKDPQGKPMYTAATIPGGTYPKGLQPGSFFSSGPISTVAVDAVFVTNSNWIDAHSTDYDSLLRAVNNAVPAIKNRVEAK